MHQSAMRVQNASRDLQAVMQGVHQTRGKHLTLTKGIEMSLLGRNHVNGVSLETVAGRPHIETEI